MGGRGGTGEVVVLLEGLPQRVLPVQELSLLTSLDHGPLLHQRLLLPYLPLGRAGLSIEEPLLLHHSCVHPPPRRFHLQDGRGVAGETGFWRLEVSLLSRPHELGRAAGDCGREGQVRSRR